MTFTPRFSRPEAGNKYYIRKQSGGYSPCIKGNPADSACDVLSNCVGYAIGRYNEIGGHGSCKLLRSTNAENFIEVAKEQGLPTGNVPKLGAVIVWQKGATLSGSDGAGHVAIVEQINADGSIVTSESGYGSSVFWTKRRTNDGNWCGGSAYKFRGFIYQLEEMVAPEIKVDTTLTAFVKEVQTAIGAEVDGIAGKETLSKTVTLSRWQNNKHAVVKAVQRRLIALGYSCGEWGVDGSYGPATASAVTAFQKAHGCIADGIITKRNKTWRKLLGIE